MKKTWAMLKDDTGAALMMAIFTVTMLMIIATEIMYETNVELQVSAQTINQVRAHYAAKAGLEISLLRLHIYRKVTGMLGDAAKEVKMIDMIWQMPFAWPPIVPEGTSGVDKGEIKDSVKKSLMQGNYVAQIESESSKIDLSLLALTGEAGQILVKATEAQLLQVFTSQMETDEDFARRYTGTDFQKIINNIKDWVDEDDKSDNGGDESSMYTDFKPANTTQKFPPNQPFKTFEELHLVAGMTDEFYKLLIPRVTIYGAKAVNIKYAKKEVLMATFKLKDEQAEQVITERNKQDTTSFKDADSFMKYLQDLGVKTEEFYDANKKLLIPILVESEFNFRVKVTGSSGKVSRDITAIVYDYDRVLEQLKKIKPAGSPAPATPTPDPAASASGGGPAPAPTPTPAPANAAKPVPNERPNIVYWNET